MKWLLLMLVACDPAPVTIDEMPCTGTTLTYDNFGAAFLNENCNTCHSASTGDRHGAPASFTFDTLDEVRAHKDRIFVRAAGPNTSMPPGPVDPPSEARDRLAEWLACGAP
jgi:uncharacterized membrane protein